MKMRILLVGSGDFDTPVYSLNNLLKEQHEVRVFDIYKNLGLPKVLGGQLSLVTEAWVYFLRAAIREPFKISNEYLVKAARQFRPDLILVITIQSVLPDTVRRIKSETGAKVIGWFMDAISNFERGYFMLADYDALFFVDPYIVDVFRLKAGADRVHFLPICCDPTLHKRVALSSGEQEYYGCDLTIAGNLYSYRAILLEQFQDYDLKIWGHRHRWLHHPLNGKHTGRPVYGVEKSKAMRAAKIILNTNHYANIRGVNKRTFEVAGAGAFQLTDAPGLADVFKPGVEIVTFETKKDLKEKVDYYLARPEDRAEIGERAYRRAHADHTFSHRWQKILQILAENGHRLPPSQK